MNLRRLLPPKPRNKSAWTAACFAVAVWVAAAAPAPQTVVLDLRNGDRLSGVIVLESTNGVVLSNAWSRELVLPAAQIVRRITLAPAVVPLAARFFDLQTNKLNLTLGDGRHFLNRCRKQYDVVVLDAFLGDSSPSHLMTQEAFASIRRVLRPGGTLVINSFGDLEAGKDFFAASLNQTLRAVFPGVRIHTSGDGGIFFAASDRAPLEFAHPPSVENVHPEVLRDTQDTYSGRVETLPGHGRVLTDDYNPAEFYDARNREDLRRRLAMAAKEL